MKKVSNSAYEAELARLQIDVVTDLIRRIDNDEEATEEIRHQKSSTPSEPIDKAGVTASSCDVQRCRFRQTNVGAGEVGHRDNRIVGGNQDQRVDWIVDRDVMNRCLLIIVICAGKTT